MVDRGVFAVAFVSVNAAVFMWLAWRIVTSRIHVTSEQVILYGALRTRSFARSDVRGFVEIKVGRYPYNAIELVSGQRIMLPASAQWPRQAWVVDARARLSAALDGPAGSEPA